ncbi:uncharacterized protein LOC128959031 [Oppia nitens]|uniref:uncharacterized protein LOC128959031 n=1 Tax=Oppia nitens TaxID=1686743 RepID=UPI0023DCC55F|nr:uncharacterized protein LOC128959031 [Oppia nitens]
MSSSSTTTTTKKSDTKDTKKYDNMFRIFAKEGNEGFGIKELSDVVQYYGIETNDRELREMMFELDSFGTDTVTFNQFVKLATKKMKDSEAEEDLRNAFRVLDKEGNGFISIDEFKQTMSERLSTEEINELILEVDLGDNREINYEELITVWVSVSK